MNDEQTEVGDNEQVIIGASGECQAGLMKTMQGKAGPDFTALGWDCVAPEGARKRCGTPEDEAPAEYCLLHENRALRKRIIELESAQEARRPPMAHELKVALGSLRIAAQILDNEYSTSAGAKSIEIVTDALKARGVPIG